jgi:hypothetical protein
MGDKGKKAVLRVIDRLPVYPVVEEEEEEPEVDIEDELYQIATVLTTEIRNELSFKQGKAMLYEKLLYAYNKGKEAVD